MIIIKKAILYIHKLLSDIKNGGTCFDNGGTDKFSCTCDLPYVGEVCEINLCDSTICQNGGICAVELINGILTPKCDCPDNYVGDFCQFGK